jgi:hypothetical protein
MFGAFYAFFFSINRLRPSIYWPIATQLSFLLLVVCSIVLITALELDLFWQVAIGFILVCYYFSTYFIWNLSVATHAEHPTQAGTNSSTNDCGGNRNDD